MKKFYLSFLFGGLMSSILHAQLTPGSIASDFTVQAYQSWLSSAGFNGDGSYNLYDYLDSGYTVIIDVSATWCGPCWNYHTSGELEDLYANHGPSGFPGVNSTTTDDLMIIWIEGDGSTSNATMLDGAGSIGNWIEPVSGHKVQFPMANPASSLANQINSNYDIAYFPTIYKICPNRVVELVGQGTASQLYSAVLACPAPASEPNDGALLSYQGLAKSCKPIDLKVKLQNNGTTPLTSTTIAALVGGNQVASFDWTGNLPTYGITDVTIGQYLPSESGENVVFKITSADALTTNNTIAKTLAKAKVVASNNITVKVLLDQYGSETSWKIKKGNGTVAYSSPSYTDAASNGSYPQEDINMWLPDDCYTLEVMDSYGDGFDGSYGNGYVQIWANGSVVGGVDVLESDFASDKFQLEFVAGLNEAPITSFNIYPNPVSDVLNIRFEAANKQYEMQLVDLQGRLIWKQEFSGLEGTQNISIPVSDFAKGSYCVHMISLGLTNSQLVVIE